MSTDEGRPVTTEGRVEHEISGPYTSASCSCGWSTSSESEGDVWRDILAHQEEPDV